MENKKEIKKETLSFIKQYKRLPLMEEDEFKREKYFDTDEEYIDYLFDNRILTYKLISKHTGLHTVRIKNLLQKDVKRVPTNERRKIEMFFNKDYFPELGKYNSKCSKCNKKCKQHYWTDVVFCKYSKV